MPWLKDFKQLRARLGCTICVSTNDAVSKPAMESTPAWSTLCHSRVAVLHVCILREVSVPPLFHAFALHSKADELHPAAYAKP